MTKEKESNTTIKSASTYGGNVCENITNRSRIKNPVIDGKRNRHDRGWKCIRAILLCAEKDTLRHFPLLGGLSKQL